MTPTVSRTRGVRIFLAVVIGIAPLGYVVGLRHGPPQESPVRPAAVVEAEVLPATEYLAMDSRQQGVNQGWKLDLGQLDRPESNLLVEVVVTPEEKRASLEERSERRAFNGAPPTIPHEIDEISADACLVCHGDGMQIGDRTARPMPHANLVNCTQCHVPESRVSPVRAAEIGFLPDRRVAPGELTRFDGLPAPFEGERAWVGAPPTIPHSTAMRTNCLACHGPLGAKGLRTSHPWRQNCQQCHAPSSTLDQVPLVTPAEFLPPPAELDR